ncbi:MAG: DUF6714 family protein [Patescibacteria group bacterium]
MSDGSTEREMLEQECVARIAVINAIASAFGDTHMPPAAPLLRHDSYSEDEVMCFVSYTNWRSVTDKTVEENPAALSFFSACALVAFLPAYLIWVLNNYRTSDSFTVDSTVYALDAWGNAERTRFSKLNAAQRCAIKGFLEFLATYGHGNVDLAGVESALHCGI